MPGRVRSRLALPRRRLPPPARSRLALPRPVLARRWSATTLALRLTLLATGALALALAPDGRFGVPGAIAAAGVLGLLFAVPEPQGAGPAVVLGAAALSWAARHGSGSPPVGLTLLLAVLLAVHHQAAALAAALPVTARVDRRLLARFGGHVALVLGLSGLLAGLALGLARPGGSVPLELAGLTGAVVATAVLVLLGRGGGQR
ncbi:MAG: hypothetical protein ACJ73E_16870 [Mycobacteriales bacterium]